MQFRRLPSFDGPCGRRFRRIIPSGHGGPSNRELSRVENGAVQVSDATTGPGAPVGRKDDPAGRGAETARKAAHTGSRFRDTLRRGGSDEPGTAGPEMGAAAAAALAGWIRPEPGPRQGTPPPPIAPTAPPAPPPRIDRILVGEVGGDVEARIRIGAGVLAGAEIRLSSAPGSRAVAAELLTRTDSSRQTLSVAMDELRVRLRRRGIVLAARSRGGDGRGAPRTDGSDGSRSGGRTGW
jgi:hypothetical protein